MRAARLLLTLVFASLACQARHELAASGEGGEGHTSAHPDVAGAPSDAPGDGVVAGAGPGGAPAGTAGVASMAPGECLRSQFVLGSSVENARDLGGVPVDGGGAIACGTLFRGPPLYNLESTGCSAVAALGIRTVIDLRQPFERDSKPTTDCVAAEQVQLPLPIPYELSPQNYLDVLGSPAVAQAFHVFADPDAYPIYFHCTWGRDRTGVVGALLLLALGVNPDDVMAEYMLSEPSVGAYPDSLTAVLDEIERRGGATMFLRDLGLSEEELAALRERALQN
jgi:hypothetical protein